MSVSVVALNSDEKRIEEVGVSIGNAISSGENKITTPIIRTGIYNLGNTCFINASLQAFSRVWKTSFYFQSKEYSRLPIFESKPSHLKDITNQWQDIVDALLSPDITGVAPRSFYRIFRESANLEHMEHLVNGQNDAHECLMFFLECLHKATSSRLLRSSIDTMEFDETSLKKTITAPNQELRLSLEKKAFDNWHLHYKGEDSPILNEMYGQFLTVIASHETKEKSFSMEPFGCLQLPVPKESERPGMMMSIPIQDCIDSFFHTEILSETTGNGWNSEELGRKVNASKAMRIWRSPDVLIITLSRFGYFSMGHKMNTPIEYPLTDLDLTMYTSGPALDAHDAIYNLTSIVLHVGGTQGGHYMSILRNPGGQWMFADDNHLEPITPEQAKSRHSSVYILFYMKKSICSGKGWDFL
jgi:ubiquitin C-terminal hydrolase